MLFEYICSTLLPLISFSLLYTYLTLKSSCFISLIYRLLNKLFVILSPILPNMDWFITGSSSILSSVLIYVFYKYVFIQEKNDIRKRKERFFEKMSYATTLFLCIILVCFMLGLFRYEPIAILSNSMSPLFSRGDMVIYKKLNDAELQDLLPNSIIIYRIGNQNIAHRIVRVIKENGNVLYQTKGDYNNASDMDLVGIEQIKGVYLFHIKYIGFPSVLLYEYFNSKSSKVEAK